MALKVKKPSCGLCRKTKKLTKTPCCDNWICNDTDQYVMFSYGQNNCYRNHDSYTLCSHHHHNNHSEKWQDCTKCKDDFQMENYVDYATNDFNFEKLA